MEIWVVEDGFQTKAYIASCHLLIETYRGYLLCSNTSGHTFLIDMRTHTYMRGSAAHLLRIDGVDQAKRFGDELCRRLQVEGERPSTSITYRVTTGGSTRILPSRAVRFLCFSLPSSMRCSVQKHSFRCSAKLHSFSVDIRSIHTERNNLTAVRYSP
jgi:hypothetical protein